MQQRENVYYCAVEKEKEKSRTIGSLELSRSFIDYP